MQFPVILLYNKYPAGTKHFWDSLGHIPLAEEINDDPEMPAYVTYLRKFKTEKEIIKQSKVEPRYHRLARINNQFCNDCLYDPRKCGCEIEECKEQAELYYRFLDKKLHV